ncbi:PREDICTED: uncharacterized protein LOC109236605 [Nicotiana attenuata]|uniref:uncharacterized protein LOC109236605 n=1 Tax=Nicotiana attenuata TaxID=49451 RepID=UPI0009048E11|nr:PREDICTED: uncharacterized protein LOC109236605 [Nicotiana attenuata]
MPLQPPLPPLAPGEAYPFLPLASRWILRRGNYQGSNAHHNLPLVRDVLDMLVDGQFIWTPYSDELLAQLPDICSVDRLLWSTSVPMIFFDMVEYHATERVLRQFHRPQPIPGEPGWVATHYQRDDIYMGWLEQQVHTWEQRGHRIPPQPTFTQEATIYLYTSWYRRHTRLMIGNPIHILGDRYRPYAGRHWLLGIITSTSWDRRCSSMPTILHSLTMAGGWHGWLVGPCFRREMPRGWTTRLSMRRQRTTIRVGVSHEAGVGREGGVPHEAGVPHGVAGVVGDGKEVVPSKGAMRHLLAHLLRDMMGILEMRLLEMISRVMDLRLMSHLAAYRRTVFSYLCQHRRSPRQEHCRSRVHSTGM